MDQFRYADASAIALVDLQGNQTSYLQLRDFMAATQGRLVKALGDSRRCMILLPDHPSTAALQLCLIENWTALPVNPALSKNELISLAQQLRAEVLFARDDDLLAREIADLLSLVKIDLRPREDGSCGLFELNIPTAKITVVPEASEVALVLATSGSTGTPKLVPLKLNALMQSAEKISSFLQLSQRDTALHALPMFHIGALVDLLLAPLLAGGRVCFAHPLASERVWQAAQMHKITWLQVVPAMLSRLLIELTEEQLSGLGCSLRFVRMVSSELPATLQQQAEQQLTGTPLIQMYGMTEACGQIASNPLPPAVRKTGSVGRIAGPQLCLVDSYGNQVAEGEEGEICISGDTVTEGYENRDSESVFFGKWLRTGDLGRFDSDGYLQITGRLKEIVNRGGEKIALREIDQCALAHHAVLEAAAFAVPHPSLGEEIGIALVAKSAAGEPSSLGVEQMQGYFETHLAEFKRPRHIWILDQLPKLGSGKIDRRRLQQMAVENSNEPQMESFVPKTPTERLLARLWVKILKASAPVPTDNFFDLGGDSLAATSFLAALEKATGASFPSDLLYRSQSYGELVAALDNHQQTAYQQALSKPLFDSVRRATAAWPGKRAHSESLIVERNGLGSRQPLFWSAAGLEHFDDLAESLGSDRPFYMMRTLSRLKQKNDVNTVRLAEHYVSEIENIQPEGPICIGGFCQGAVVARLVARRLAERDRQINLVVEVDRLFDEPLHFPTLLAWSQSSQHSARVAYQRPELGLPYLYPEGVEVLALEYPHEKVMSDESASQLARRMAELMDSDANRIAKPAGRSPGWQERQAMYAAQILAQPVGLARTNSELSLKVKIRNLSSLVWQPTDASGIYLAARWINLDGHHRIANAGWVALSEPVQPGAETEVSIHLQTPSKRLPYVLMLDLVDDGIGWFYQRGNKPAKQLVWCLR